MTDSLLNGQRLKEKKTFHVNVFVLVPSPESGALYILGSRRLLFLLQNTVTDVERCFFNRAFRAEFYNLSVGFGSQNIVQGCVHCLAHNGSRRGETAAAYR